MRPRSLLEKTVVPFSWSSNNLNPPGYPGLGFFCKYVRTTLTFIPDSISRDELLRLTVNAEPDFVPAEDSSSEFESELDKDCWDAINAFHEKHPNPAAAQTLALAILSKLGAWHSNVADRKFEERDESCLLWKADEAVIATAFSLISQVELGDAE